MLKVMRIVWDNATYRVSEPNYHGGTVVTLDELTRWLEGHLVERRYNNTVPNGVIDDLLDELTAARRA